MTTTRSQKLAAQAKAAFGAPTGAEVKASHARRRFNAMTREDRIDLLARFNRYVNGETFALSVSDVDLLHVMAEGIPYPDTDNTAPVVITGWDTIVNAYREAKAARQ